MDLPWCVVARVVTSPSGIVSLHTAKIPEHVAHYALKHDWMILIRDSEMPNGPHDLGPLQSNPHRTEDE